MLGFGFLLPGELLVWSRALDHALADSYLTKHLYLSFLWELPPWLLPVVWGAALCCLLRGCVELGRGSHACDAMLFGSFPLYMLSMFLFFRLPCGVAVATPCLSLGAAALWFAFHPPGRPAFPVPDDPGRTATALDRLTALFPLLTIQCGAWLMFQEGYLLWLSFRWTPLLALLPLAGILLPKQDEIREYVLASAWALLLCALVFGAGLLFVDGAGMTDFSIVLAYLFLELEVALILRPLLPKVRNRSLVILLASLAATPRIMPPVCRGVIVTMVMYVLYLFLDNRHAIRKKLFSRSHFRNPQIRFLTWEEYAAQALGFGALLAVCLAGPKMVPAILTGIAAVFMAAMLRTKLPGKAVEDPVLLRNFPYAAETAALALTVIVCSPSLEAAMTLGCAYVCASCLMRTIWGIGALIGGFVPERHVPLVFQALSYGALCFLLFLLSCFQAPVSLALGLFCLLSGVIQIGAASSLRRGGKLRFSVGWLLIAIGQVITVMPPHLRLPVPQWSSGAAVCALAACAGLYFFRTFDFRTRNGRAS